MTKDHADCLRRLAHKLSDEISVARGDAHAAFDPLWKTGQMTRSQAYKWLAAKMNISVEDCHMEKFTVQQCRKVVEICR